LYDLAHNLGRTNKVKGRRPPAGIDYDEDDAQFSRQLKATNRGPDVVQIVSIPSRSLLSVLVPFSPTPQPNNKERQAKNTSKTSTRPYGSQ
jgi:hypothetical protein